MRKTKGTVVALSTVAALLATGGAAAAVAGSDASPVSADSSQTQAQTAKDRHDKAKKRHGKAKKRLAKHAPKADGAKALCKHAPKIDKRIDRVQNRLDGGLRTRGSIDRLEKRIENAKKAGHGVIADFLNDRLDDRRELKVRLKDREEGLKKVRAWCATQDDGKSEKNSSGESSDS
ncbi:hypothetical protein G4Z16_14660 [Streptomyces bathyalis]|uniref:Uncharacterized protein n=1 Tax=Streptomyces bathyalis TaxID=2710756 RepID=A0A7T1T6S4_9ACTN|nr:hypothetical protein [Streptomyces bathyalis]QPP07417.1 hypothetical protein G4Z16_14660 [Streptomyces bathyalis]